MFALLLNTLIASSLVDEVFENINEHSTSTESETQETSKPVLNLTGYKKINLTVDLNKPEDELVSEMIHLVKNECPNYKNITTWDMLKRKCKATQQYF